MNSYQYKRLSLIIIFFLLLTTISYSYICGDTNNDSEGPNVADVVFLVDYIFKGGDEPDITEAADVDGSPGILVSDIVYLVDYLFKGGDAPICDSIIVVNITYPIVDTDQELCYNTSSEIAPPLPGETYYGQDAQYDGNQMSYTLSGDGLTVDDNITGLTWTQSPDLEDDGDIDVYDKLTFTEAIAYPATLNAQNYGGYNDWRLPSMKDLYSIMNFSGTDPSGPNPINPIPFIDTAYFDFGYGDEANGERLIDAQFWTTSVYVGYVFDNQEAAFGLNLADGRIKGYPTGTFPITKLNYVYFVRGNTDYGINNFIDNSDSTITDSATGLMWTQNDMGDGSSNGPRSGMTWVEALQWAENKNAENYLGHNDWRLPNAKELHSILDYSRGPDSTNSAAIDPIFNITQITNEEGDIDYPWHWTSTSHTMTDGAATNAAYICFGRGIGYMMNSWMDVHGAGCQRSDRKDGSLTGYTFVYNGYYFGIAPQGDAARLYNYVRLVRDAF